jgi:hypothetical protein
MPLLLRMSFIHFLSTFSPPSQFRLVPQQEQRRQYGSDRPEHEITPQIFYFITPLADYITHYSGTCQKDNSKADFVTRLETFVKSLYFSFWQ